jgi:dihydrofolate synthase / folylpolyglutamate synthase
MKFIKIKTRCLLPPRDDIYPILDKHLPKLKEGDVLLITSKVLAIHQGRCIGTSESRKSDLINKEADYSLPTYAISDSEIILTIKDHTLIPSAGIDESNGNGYYILWPKNNNRLCKEICNHLKKKCKIKKLAVIAADSHTTPLRWGTLGISIGFYGLEPTYDYRGKKDIFGRNLKYTQSNIVDSLAAMGVLLMGEGGEKVPMVIIRDADFIKFTNKPTHKNFLIPPKKDLYYPLLKIFSKKANPYKKVKGRA